MSIGKKQLFLRASYYEYLESLLYRSNTMASIMQYNWRYKSQQYLRSLHLSSAKVLMVHHFVHMFSIQSSRASRRPSLLLLTIQRRFRVYYHSRRFRLARYLSTWLSSHFRAYKARATTRMLSHNGERHPAQYQVLLLDKVSRRRSQCYTLLYAETGGLHRRLSLFGSRRPLTTLWRSALSSSPL
jgi:hypothetical protein